MPIEMKPCPFCGETETGDDGPGLVDGMEGHDTIFVRCLGCGAEGPVVAYVVDPKTQVVTSWEKAVQYWNWRKG